MSAYWLDEREDRVGEPAPLAHLLEEARGRGAAEDRCRARAARSGARRRARVPAPPRQTWYCSVSLRSKRTRGASSSPARGAAAGGRAAPAAAAARAGAPARRARRGRPTRRPRSRRCAARSGRAWKAAMLLDRRAARRPRRVPMTARPSGCVAEDRLAEHVEDLVLRIVLVHRDLLEHDLALGVEVAEARAARPCRSSRRTRRSRCASSTRVYSEVVSLPVPALSSAPIASKIWSISCEP